MLSLFILSPFPPKREGYVTHTKSYAITRRYSDRPSDLDPLLPLLLFFLFFFFVAFISLRVLRPGDYHWWTEIARVTLLSFLRLPSRARVTMRKHAKLFVLYRSDQFDCLDGTNV